MTIKDSVIILHCSPVLSLPVMSFSLSLYVCLFVVARLVSKIRARKISEQNLIKLFLKIGVGHFLK